MSNITMVDDTKVVGVVRDCPFVRIIGNKELLGRAMGYIPSMEKVFGDNFAEKADSLEYMTPDDQWEPICGYLPF